MKKVLAWWSSMSNGVKHPPLCYHKVSALQRELVLRKKNAKLSIDLVLLLEHKPTFTMGRRSWVDYDKITSPSIRHSVVSTDIKNIEELLQTNAVVAKSDRGGLITFHGPGQLMAYPIVNLGIWNRGLKWYVETLQKSVINMTKEIGISDAMATENVGVWVGGGQRKIAFIGFHVDRWITSHGIAYNVDVDLRWFDYIIPCGLADKKTTSVKNERPDIDIDVSQTATMLLSHIGRQFEVDVAPLKDLDAGLCQEIEEYIFDE